MPTSDHRPLIIPSPVDPDVECVRIDTQVPSGELAQPPGPSPTDGDDSHLCPDGYVPRRRRRRDYTLNGYSRTGCGELNHGSVLSMLLHNFITHTHPLPTPRGGIFSHD